MNNRTTFGSFFKEGKTTNILWVAVLLLSVLKILPGDSSFFAQQYGDLFQDNAWLDWWKWIYHFFATFLLFGLAPIFIWKWGIQRPVKEIGLCLGDVRAGSLFLLVSFIVLPFVVWYASLDPEHAAYYPRTSLATTSTERFIQWSSLYAFHYIGWEVFYRGFIGLGMRGTLGSFGALALQTTLTTLMHIGKPAGETWGALAGGVLLGLVTYRTRSILYAFIFHWYLGIMNTYFCGSW